MISYQTRWLRTAALTLAVFTQFCGSVCAQAGNAAPQAPTVTPTKRPEIRVEFFGAERGYAIGPESIVFLCVVRNVGGAALPENTLRLRCYPASGLDYTEGDTAPKLPALAPDQAVAYRWKLMPTDLKTPMVASVLFERILPVPQTADSSLAPQPGGPRVVLRTQLKAPQTSSPEAQTMEIESPSAVLAVVPRLPSPPRLDNPADSPNPAANAAAGQAWIGNNLAGVRILATDKRIPLLLLAAKEGAGWHTVATGITPPQVLSGEDGQIPWWETFRWRESRVTVDKEAATLSLTGTFGSRWKAEWILESRPNTAAISGRLRLTALRKMQIYGMRFPQLLAETSEAAPRADGSPQAVVNDSRALAENTRLAAINLRGFSFGLAWPSVPPVPDWHTAALPIGEGKRLFLLGAQSESGARGETVSPGTTLIFPFRLFAFGPSSSLNDALRFTLP